MAGKSREITPSSPSEFLGQTIEIVAAYVAHNALSPGDLTRTLADVHQALRSLGTAGINAVAKPELAPAVPVKKSITPDFIICLEDGKKFKSMKRHLSGLGMTPDLYRAKWHLPHDYPMVAPNYSATRSGLAKTNGLGRKPGPFVPRAKQTGGSKERRV